VPDQPVSYSPFGISVQEIGWVSQEDLILKTGPRVRRLRACDLVVGRL